MPGLTKSLHKTDAYAIGGALGVLAIQTLLATGQPGFTVTRAGGVITAITPAAGNAFFLIEPEEATCSVADNLKVGANRYRQHQVAFKYGNLSEATSEQMKGLSLGRHTFLIKNKLGTAILLGEHNGLTAEKDDSGAGATNDDLAGHDLTLSGGEIVHAAVVAASVYDTLAAAVATAEADAGS